MITQTGARKTDHEAGAMKKEKNHSCSPQPGFSSDQVHNLMTPSVIRPVNLNFNGVGAHKADKLLISDISPSTCPIIFKICVSETDYQKAEC